MTLISKIGRKLSRTVASTYKNGVLGFKASMDLFDDYREFKRQFSQQPEFPINGYQPVLYDRYEASGRLCHHYFDQDLLIAQRIFKNNPQQHVDIGSRIDGFVAHVASYRPIEILDIRPLDRKIPNVTFRQADLMKLPTDLIHYTDSLSSLHVIEHFGLGRYGDPIDINGHLKALDTMYEILKPGGKFYLSVPVGQQGVIFNAHRLFSVGYLTQLLERRYNLDHFYLIDDTETVRYDVDPRQPDAASSFGCKLGCGLFEMTKL